MGYRSSAFNPTDAYCFYNPSGNSWWPSFSAPWGFDGNTLSPTVSSHGYYWNGKTNNDTVYIKYQRSSNTLTVTYGSTAGTQNSQLPVVWTTTCNTGDHVVCAMSTGGDGTFIDIVSFVGNAV